MQNSTHPKLNYRQTGLGLLLVLVVFCCSGATCSRSLRNPFASLGPPAPEVLAAGASLEQVIAAVNQNSARIHSYQTNSASITVPGLAGVPSLRGNIVAQRPGRLRLEASTALTGPEVDLGSNDELFWFWVKRNEPPALYFSRHDQFVGSAAQQVMPIEPQWLLDALGLAQFSPNDHHEGPVPHTNGTLEIRTVMQTRSGPMTKSTVIDARRAWVLQQHIYDSRGTLLASSRARSHRYYPDWGVSLPQTIDVNLVVAQMALSIDVGAVQLNSVPDNPALWTLPALSDYPQIDLGSAPPGAVSAIGRPGSKDWNTLASPAIVGISPETNNTYPQVGQPLPARIADSRQPLPPPRTLQVEVPTSGPVTQQLRPGGVPISEAQGASY
ncbi:MAG: hypothetical protein MI725_17910 [Pirellulales bacterium]|nr:hypothetical protein [Pirellulales bacterium]